MPGYEWSIAGGRPVGIANWTAIENAIQAQVVAASGLAASNVIWSFQSRSKPTRDFIRLELDSIESQNSVTPETSTIDNPTPSAGAEIVSSSEEQIDFTVEIHFFTGVSGGTGSARSRLATILRYMSAEEVTTALDASGVALIDCGPVTALPVVLDAEYESRARATLALRTVDGFRKTATYIQTAAWTTTIT